MRKQVRFIIFLQMVVLMVSIMSGCFNGQGSAAKGFTINGVSIEKYKIIYAENPETDYLAQYPKYNVIEDIQFDRITAEELRDAIQELFGVTLEVCLDYRTEVTDYEILVGATNRTIVKEDFFAMSSYDMLAGVDGNKLYLRGGCFGATYSAKEKLVAFLRQQSDNGKKLVALDEDYAIKEEAQLTTIACVGDSITEGASVFIEDVVVDFAENKAHYSWPVVLQRIFWKTCYVYNLGCSGSCVRTDIEEHAYVNTLQWSTLMSVADKVDITLIMLGDNDSFWDTNHKLSDDEVQIFMTSYEAMVQSMLEKNPEMRFTMFNCPVAYGHPNSATQEVLDAQLMTYASLMEKNYPIEFFDMREASKKLDRSVFSDGIHLSSRGSGVFAQLIASVCEDFYKLEP